MVSEVGNATRVTTSARRGFTSQGFTLIEVLVVIVVIAVLASLVAPSLFRNVDDARVATAKAQIESFATALDAYRLDTGRYPTSAQGLASLNTRPTADAPPTWNGPYLRKSVPVDPWGHAYAYVAPGVVNPQGYDLMSYGADGKPGGEGKDADLTSWK